MSNQQESRAGSEVPASLPSSNPAIDAHGFDPAEYKWVPVRRRPRRDGWSPRKMVAFIQALSDTGCVTLAAKEAGMSARSAYALRRAPGAERFAAAWEAAVGQAAHRLVDVAFDRAINGTIELLYDRDGNCTGQKVRHNDRLLMFLMRAHFPERYRTAHASFRSADEALPARPEPVARSIATLQPVAPPQPHRLLDAEELDHELTIADLSEGDLPHFYDDIPTSARNHGDTGPSDAFVAPAEDGDDAPALRDAPIPFHPLPPQAPTPEALAHAAADEDDACDDDADAEADADADDEYEEDEDPADRWAEYADDPADIDAYRAAYDAADDGGTEPVVLEGHDPDEDGDDDAEQARMIAAMVARVADQLGRITAPRTPPAC